MQKYDIYGLKAFYALMLGFATKNEPEGPDIKSASSPQGYTSFSFFVLFFSQAEHGRAGADGVVG